MNDNTYLSVEDKIDQYINGDLSEHEIDDLWEELIQKDKYMNYLKNSANLDPVVSETPESAARPVWMYAAAAVVVLMLAVLTLFELGVFQSSKTIEPINNIELDYYRSADVNTPLSDQKKIIRKAIMLFNKGQTKQAVNMLSGERDKANEPQWITKLDMTLGTMYYDQDQFNNSSFYFADVVKLEGKIDKLKLEKAYWYLGNSYFQLNMLKEAQVAMQKAYKLNGAYSRVAKSYLDAMKDVKTRTL